jgi:hypothetical protein
MALINITKQEVIDFLKKNIKSALIVIGAIVLLIWLGILVGRLKSMAAKMSSLTTSDQIITRDRDSLLAENIRLKAIQSIIKHEKDSIIVIKEQKEAQLQALIRKHHREIDSLVNPLVPNDSVFARLQPIYPNVDHEPLNYPFAGTQVRQIYSVAVSYPRIQKEYTLQTSVLQSCNALNTKFRDSELNYQKQIDNLTKNISACDQLVKNKDQEVKLTKKQLGQKTFWNWTYKAAALVLAGFVILK